MDKQVSSLPIAVVIATKDRFTMLSERSIPSVVAQTHRPAFVVVVDDSSAIVRSMNRSLITSIHLPGSRVTYLENARTQGASGSWNTALDFLFGVVENPEHFFIAILDDDDAWEPNYLEECYTIAGKQNLDMVATDFRRIENINDIALTNKAPEILSAGDFLAENPGIQGSNLFLRMNLFLYSGGFDEELRSTTDRDICIRIADLGNVRYGRLSVALVSHFAEPDRLRLSTRGSEAKLEGLTAFWRKYIGRMTSEQRQAFCKRAKALFDWQQPPLQFTHPNPDTEITSGTTRPTNPPSFELPSASALDAGIILSTTTPTAHVGSLYDSSEKFLPWIEQERISTAEHRLRSRFSLVNLRLLGCGSESIVFTDERFVYKCIDGWKTRMSQSQLEFLQSQIGRWTDVQGLYALHQVTLYGCWAVITYKYETSTTYQGGHEEDIIGLLTSCCRVGIICNNIHPKNLVVTKSGVKLIDYGADIQPWSPAGFEDMARRAFLACNHADHPDLQLLMRRSLVDTRFQEFIGYSLFRERLDDHIKQTTPYSAHTPAAKIVVPAHEPFVLYVGIISSDPIMLRPLLDGLALLCLSPSIKQLGVVVLDNGDSADEMQNMIENTRKAGLQVALVSKVQQRRDAASGAFGSLLRERSDKQVGIAQARTMLQRYLGTLLRTERGSFGWLLDDDMRVDDRALIYLPWLPAFRDDGVDVLIGHYEGSSPNPPLNGLRVNLVDLFHNLVWLQHLPPDALLPDRTAENAALRVRYPDYYYDLSRKHTGHLEMPHWLEPIFKGETVREALLRLLSGAVDLLNGISMTRPIITNVPLNPLISAKDSVNRGGCTFILNYHALTLTPNTTLHFRGQEARRSDMIWAIVNRYYRRLNIKAVAFPIQHLGRATTIPRLNIEKVQGELIGSSLYAGLTEFLTARPFHELNFSMEETSKVQCLAKNHLEQRLRALKQSCYRIAGLCQALKNVVDCTEINFLLQCLTCWYSQETFEQIHSGVWVQTWDDVELFLTSLQSSAEDFALADVDINFIHNQIDNLSYGDDG